VEFESIRKHINIASIILAGGKGTRLYPLTLNHSKPAVSYGGRYKLIDIPISNSLNSNIRQILVIGQYLTTELAHHLSQTYQFDNFFPGRLDLITPQEKPNGERIFFNGTADAIRKTIDIIMEFPVDYFLILSGDQLYNIDFQKMFHFAKEKDADLTIAAITVNEEDAKRMGLLKINSSSYITNFYEKPQEKSILDSFKLSDSFYEKCKVLKKEPYLGSMGIYIFKRDALKALLIEDDREDFGKHLIPTQLKKGKAAAFVYDGYWEDIGTIKSFYDANIALALSNSGLKTYDEKNPIYTSAHHLPGAKIKSTKIENSIICEGSIINAKEITNSMVGLRAKIGKNTIIKNCVLLGNSSYTSPIQHPNLAEVFEIGDDCLLEKVIIDEHVRIGNRVKLVNKKNLSTYDGDNIYVRDNIIIITAGASIPDGFEF
jgi:glucose-1-phosphate adenylyltransferase